MVAKHEHRDEEGLKLGLAAATKKKLAKKHKSNIARSSGRFLHWRYAILDFHGPVGTERMRSTHVWRHSGKCQHREFLLRLLGNVCRTIGRRRWTSGRTHSRNTRRGLP